MMTVPMCLKFCRGYEFAGLEYARFGPPPLSMIEDVADAGDLSSRECYCSKYLSVKSKQLPDSACDLACSGNKTQFCGGSLTVSIYQRSSDKKGAASASGKSRVGNVLALGIAVSILVGWT